MIDQCHCLRKPIFTAQKMSNNQAVGHMSRITYKPATVSDGRKTGLSDVAGDKPQSSGSCALIREGGKASGCKEPRCEAPIVDEEGVATCVETSLVSVIKSLQFSPGIMAQHPTLAAVMEAVARVKEKDVLTKTLEAHRVSRLYVPLPDSGNEWSHLVLLKGFPKHLKYALVRGNDQVLCHSGLNDDGNPWFNLKDPVGLLAAIQKGDVWIDSPGSVVCKTGTWITSCDAEDDDPSVWAPQIRRFFNSKYNVAFKDGDALTLHYSLYPNDWVMFDTNNLSTVNLQFQAPVDNYFVSSASQRALAPILRKKNAAAQDAQRHPFIIVGLWNVHGWLPDNVVCTQKYIQ
jgi:hypothetical protein